MFQCIEVEQWRAFIYDQQLHKAGHHLLRQVHQVVVVCTRLQASYEKGRQARSSFLQTTTQLR